MSLVDRILDGRLAELLEGWANDGLSHEQMAFRLQSDYDIEVSSETIRRWRAEISAGSAA